jgi:hypothetical protein
MFDGRSAACNARPAMIDLRPPDKGDQHDDQPKNMMKGWWDVVLKVREARRPRRSVIELRSDFDAQTVRSIAEELRGRPRERLLVVAAIFDGVTREAGVSAALPAQTKEISSADCV